MSSGSGAQAAAGRPGEIAPWHELMGQWPSWTR
jgi:hypothetical protein